jgi:hypothetical protein
MKKYRKKPVEVEAVEFTGENWAEIVEWSGEAVQQHPGRDALVMDAMGGTVTAEVGDYIIKGVDGEFYPCKEQVFIETYDLVEQP